MTEKILITKPADLKALEGKEGYVEVIDGKTYFCLAKKAEA